jgi:hypothetical protein
MTSQGDTSVCTRITNTTQLTEAITADAIAGKSHDMLAGLRFVDLCVLCDDSTTDAELRVPPVRVWLAPHNHNRIRNRT